MIYVPAGAQNLDSHLKLDLAQLVNGSQLVNGVDAPLPSMGDVRNEMAKQRIAIVSGTYEETGMLIGNVATMSNEPKELDPVLDSITKGAIRFPVPRRGQGK